MKKSCNIIKISTYVFLCLFIILFSKQLVHADVIEDSRNGVVPDKVWSVNFSDKVNYDYVNSNYIYVSDSTGNLVNVDVSVNPLNQKQVNVKPKSGKYELGKTYNLTISKEFCNEKGKKLGQDYRMQFSIKKQLVDTADFKVQVNKAFGMTVISLNSITSSDIKKYRVEGQDPKDDNVNVGEEAVIFGNYQNVNVYFYDDSGKQIGSSLLSIQKACDSQVVEIKN